MFSCAAYELRQNLDQWLGLALLTKMTGILQNASGNPTCGGTSYLSILIYAWMIAKNCPYFCGFLWDELIKCFISELVPRFSQAPVTFYNQDLVNHRQKFKTSFSHRHRAGVTNLFAIAGHFVSYRWVSGPHNFVVILWNLLKTKKIVHQQKQTTNESNNCWSHLNASRAVRNSFVGRMFVSPVIEGSGSGREMKTF